MCAVGGCLGGPSRRVYAGGGPGSLRDRLSTRWAGCDRETVLAGRLGDGVVDSNRRVSGPLCLGPCVEPGRHVALPDCWSTTPFFARQ